MEFYLLQMPQDLSHFCSHGQKTNTGLLRGLSPPNQPSWQVPSLSQGTDLGTAKPQIYNNYNESLVSKDKLTHQISFLEF